MQAAYRRNPTTHMSEVEGDIFLVPDGGGEIFYLGDVGAGVWRLLDQERDASALREILVDAFPDIPAEQIAKDVDQLLADLVAAELISVVGSGDG